MVYCRFTLCVIYSMIFEKYPVYFIKVFYKIVLRSKNPLCSVYSFHFLPAMLNSLAAIFFFYYLYCFTFSRISCSWNQTNVAFSYCLFSLSNVYLRFLYVFFWLTSLCLHIDENCFKPKLVGRLTYTRIS
jgi:hypothetical protein